MVALRWECATQKRLSSAAYFVTEKAPSLITMHHNKHDVRESWFIEEMFNAHAQLERLAFPVEDLIRAKSTASLVRPLTCASILESKR